MPPAARQCLDRVLERLRVVVAGLGALGLPMRMPSWTLAWISASWTTRSPRCGSVENSAKLAMKPPPKNSALSAPKNAAASASSASCSR